MGNLSKLKQVDAVGSLVTGSLRFRAKNPRNTDPTVSPSSSSSPTSTHLEHGSFELKPFKKYIVTYYGFTYIIENVFNQLASEFNSSSLMENGGSKCSDPSSGGFEQLVTNLRKAPRSRSSKSLSNVSHNHPTTLCESWKPP